MDRRGKSRTLGDNQKAFSERRSTAATWFRFFRDGLARADGRYGRSGAAGSGMPIGARLTQTNTSLVSVKKITAFALDAAMAKAASIAPASAGQGSAWSRALGGVAAGRLGDRSVWHEHIMT